MRIFNKTAKILLLIYFLIGNAQVFLVPINSSEAYNIRAARNIIEGKILYHDILYHHLPLLPYAYSVFSGFGFSSYILLRYISILLTLLLLTLVYFHVHKFTGDAASANFALFLLAFNGLFIDWSSLVLMFPLANVLFYLAFIIASFLIYGFSRRYFLLSFLAGLLLGLAAGTRLSYLFPGLIILICLAWHAGKLKSQKAEMSGSRMGPILVFLLGFLAANTITLYYWIKYPEHFIYGVFTNNLQAEQMKWESESNLLHWVKFFMLPQNLILFGLVLIDLRYRFMGKWFAYLVLAAMLIVHSFGYYVKMYLMVLIPFAAFIAGLGYSQITESIGIRVRKLILNFVVSIYVVSIFLGIPHFKHWIFGDILDPNLIQLKEIIDYERTLPGETILASWDAYTLFSNKRNLLKNELLYSFTYDKVTEEEIERFSLPDYGMLNKLIRDKVFDVIILHEGIPAVLFRHEETIKSVYKLNKAFRNIYVYTKD
jgi:hypothetical protein